MGPICTTATGSAVFLPPESVGVEKWETPPRELRPLAAGDRRMASKAEALHRPRRPIDRVAIHALCLGLDLGVA